MTRIARAVSWLTAIALALGCTPRPAAQIEALQTPRSFFQLLETIWQVSESGLILQDEFYTADNLRRAFGGSQVALEVGKGGMFAGYFDGTIKGFPSWIEPSTSTATGHTYEALSVRFKKFNMYPDGERKASIILILTSDSPTGVHVAEIERHFGGSWTEDERPVPPPRGIPPPRTHPDGYRGMKYTFGDSRSGRLIAFGFGRNGTLSSMVVEANREKD